MHNYTNNDILIVFDEIKFTKLCACLIIIKLVKFRQIPFLNIYNYSHFLKKVNFPKTKVQIYRSSLYFLIISGMGAGARSH